MQPKMETLQILCSSFIIPFFLFAYTASSADLCKPSTCQAFSSQAPQVRFPFRLNNQEQVLERCGYPGFGLSCNNQNQTVLHLPATDPEQFIVKSINYDKQALAIEPRFCLGNRITLFSLLGSPFSGDHLTNYTIYNCSSEAEVLPPAREIACLSGENFTVAVMASSAAIYTPLRCRNISTIAVPGNGYNDDWPYEHLYEELRLTWSTPDCRSCSDKGGTCGLKGDGSTLEIGCSHVLRHRGLPRSAKYGIIIGVGIPGLIFLIGVVGYAFGKIQAYNRRRNPDIELPTTTIAPVVFMTGLDKPTIESYPKTVVGDSGRLPKLYDVTCSICLSEYQPKDTLRTIPECKHYFHATCIDEWLALNATCPVCRKTPETSSTVTPCSSVSSSSSTSSASTS